MARKKTRRKKPQTWKPLDGADKLWLAKRICALLPDLGDGKRWHDWAYALIDEMLWYWTADALHPEKNHVWRDAIKNDPRYVSHTAGAIDALRANEKVQHEHASERAEIIDVLRRLDERDEDDVIAVLDRLNVAVLVTPTEHQNLPGVDWHVDWRKRDPRARYKGVKVTWR